jgi:hypothetical protein
LKTEKKNIIVGYKIGDLIAGLISIGFVFIALFAMDKKETNFWVVLIFFGLAAIVLLWKYVNPNNRFVSRNSPEAKRIREEEFKELFNTQGLFEYHELGFKLIIDGKLTEIKWNEVSLLIGYKIDALTTDEICLYVRTRKGKSFEISESSKGWFEFNRRMKNEFPSVNKNWEIEIAHPPFERNQTILYDKKTLGNNV